MKTKVRKHKRKGKTVRAHDRRLKVTKLAKKKAKSALERRKKLPKSKRFGLDENEARDLGIASGVARAKQIVRSDYIPYEDAKKVARFKRFNNCKTPKCEGAIDLWGGREFIKKADRHIKNQKMVRRQGLLFDSEDTVEWDSPEGRRQFEKDLEDHKRERKRKLNDPRAVDPEGMDIILFEQVRDRNG